jgi:hypothetical protein
MANQIRKTDVEDVDFLDAEELQSDGSVVYLTVPVVSTAAATRTVVVGTPSDGEGIRSGRDHPVEVGDRVIITEATGELGNGTFTIASVLTDSSFVVVESIGSSTGGSADFLYPSGASRIGIDPTNLNFTAATNVQAALESIPALPQATQIGDLLASRDGVTFSVVHPVVSADDGWLSNADGDLLIEGLD